MANEINKLSFGGVDYPLEDHRISSIVDAIYPVGSIYMSVNAANPGTLFGGTWEQIKGRFLLGTGAPDDNGNVFWGDDLTTDGENKLNESAGATGGTTRQTLNEGNLPEHAHAALGKPGDPNTADWRIPILKDIGYTSGWHSGVDTPSPGSGLTVPGCLDPNTSGNIGLNQYTGAVGNGTPHNNMPPYFVVNIWKRTA